MIDDFIEQLRKATNVYRTEQHIVVQSFGVQFNKTYGSVTSATTPTTPGPKNWMICLKRFIPRDVVSTENVFIRLCMCGSTFTTKPAQPNANI